MSDVFQNIDSPPPSPPSGCVPPPLVRGGGHTRWLERGVGVEYFERRRHSSVLYICKYFVLECMSPLSDIQTQPKDHVLRRPGEVLQRPVLLRGGILPPAEEPPLRQPCQLQGPRIR
jgi:hypothetical protein